HYIACIGATMAPMLTVESLVDKNAKKKGNNSLVVPILVCGICVFLAVGMAAYSLATSMALTAQQVKIQSEITKLAPAQQTYNTFMATKAEYAELKTMYEMTKTPNDELLAFIQELELKMPSNINVLVLSADTTAVNMNLNVLSKEEAAQVLVQLRNFESLATVETTGITDTKDETGAGSVSMSISCTYKQAVPLTEETQQ
ncbi:MAG: hypothetical protein PHX08_08495, partial [Lachnospiraceae bacterium]|nr:hypothetical protein [Lachnospiraceae bacterium]